MTAESPGGTLGERCWYMPGPQAGLGSGAAWSGSLRGSTAAGRGQAIPREPLGAITAIRAVEAAPTLPGQAQSRLDMSIPGMLRRPATRSSCGPPPPSPPPGLPPGPSSLPPSPSSSSQRLSPGQYTSRRSTQYLSRSLQGGGSMARSEAGSVAARAWRCGGGRRGVGSRRVGAGSSCRDRVRARAEAGHAAPAPSPSPLKRPQRRSLAGWDHVALAIGAQEEEVRVGVLKGAVLSAGG